MQIIFLTLLFVVGACFGSFLCCQARRLKRKTKGQKSLGPRSVCLSCKKPIKWHDNIPIISWLCLKGKCRSCHHKIGSLEILSELGLGAAFLLIGTTIDPLTATCLDWLIFLTTLALTLSLGFLAIYDGAYGELPVSILTISIICAIIILSLKEWAILSISNFQANQILDPLFSVLILGGLYFFLYLVSKGKWIGDGDWLLGTAIGIALISPWLSLIALFLSNFLACAIMLPSFIKSKNHKIYFGPFLVISFVITYSFSDFFLSLISF